MSDIFDHEADAWDDYSARWEAGDEDPGGYYENRRPRRRSFGFYKASIDRDFYHHRIQLEELGAETNKALLVRFKGLVFWLPKSICRELNRENLQVKVHWPTLDKILREVLP